MKQRVAASATSRLIEMGFFAFSAASFVIQREKENSRQGAITAKDPSPLSHRA
jgi:hypothetical protein